MKFAIRVDGNRYIGMGHLYRCLVYALNVRREYGLDIEFLTLESSLTSPVIEMFAKENIDIIKVSSPDDPWKERDNAVASVLERANYAGALVDLLEPDPWDNELIGNQSYALPNPQSWLTGFSDSGVPTIAVTDTKEKITLRANLVVNTCPAQRNEWYSDADRMIYLLGPSYYYVSEPYAKLRMKKKSFGREPYTIAIFCGGYDHCGYSTKIVESLLSQGMKSRIIVAVGVATSDGEKAVQGLRRLGVEAKFGVKNLADLFYSADLAVVTAGNTLFDLAAVGVPSVSVATRPRQEITARYFDERGSCRYAGMGDDAARNIYGVVADVLKDGGDTLARMSGAGKKAVDGKGTGRILKEIAPLLGVSEPGKIIH